MQTTKEILVETGNLKVADGANTLTTRALGSCVAITLYDKTKKIGGMVHFILPENPGGKKREKYADTGIKLLLEKMIEEEARKENLVAKMIGGAIMFGEFTDDVENSIGKRNVKKAKNVLRELGIKLTAHDTGGDYGRSVKFHLSDGKVYINSYKTGVKII
jgi:chemotaxis protein CheD